MFEHNNQNEEMNHTETNDTDVTPKEEVQRTQKQKKPFKGRGFLNTVGAGIIGSVLTLTVLPQTDYYQNIAQPRVEQSADNGQTNNSGNSGITPTSVSTNAGGDVANIVEDASESIVGIVNYQSQSRMGAAEATPAGTGSGVLFKKEGDSAFIITNNHVIEGASKIEVSLYDGEKTEGELIGADPLTDLAVVKIDGKYADNLLEVGDSSALRAGEQVIAIGNPLGLDLSRTVTQGIVSAVDRTIPVQTSEGESELNVIQTDAAINPGNSGGALLNSKGELVGINSAKISNSGVEGLGFAIPSKDFMPIVSEIIKTGKVERPYIGIGMKNLSDIPRSYLPNLPQSVESGVVVANIDPTSAAADAGIKEGDAITEMNGKSVGSVADLRRQLYGDLKVGDKIDLTVYRDGKKMTVSLKLTSNAMMNG
ncbi:trypsin-like peptidase domain-containing protein [Rossellomorea sp. SC111]|uniref:S1C family serine protease n=1 Tax=Rossellomorea sp. SC111 TaxID=2968985 RepID=UPI00215A194C|nr:trypsin-like peptidase domain-containing protein [Rossellomorea sp. SC111]MCR8848035.1 trypsin-like peptidase domain-containing protein [Rossellomorea sp. SC111]